MINYLYIYNISISISIDIIMEEKPPSEILYDTLKSLNVKNVEIRDTGINKKLKLKIKPASLILSDPSIELNDKDIIFNTSTGSKELNTKRENLDICYTDFSDFKLNINDYNINYESHGIPHYNKLYRLMIKLYTGIESGSLNYFSGKRYVVKDNVMRSYYSIKDTSSRCDDKQSYMPSMPSMPYKTNFVDFRFKLIYNYNSCIINGCMSGILLFEVDDKLIINFNIGQVVHSNVIDCTIINNFLSEVKDIITDEKYNMILLCGHSNGMSSATALSYVLMCYETNNFKKLINYETKFDGLNICHKICICGTAGFPIIFEEEKEFITYYNFYKGRYLHIVSGNITGDICFIDAYATYKLKKLRNYKYDLYIKRQTSYLSTDNDVMCYHGTIINGISSNNDENNHKIIKFLTEIKDLADPITISDIEFQINMVHDYGNGYRNILNTY